MVSFGILIVSLVSFLVFRFLVIVSAVPIVWVVSFRWFRFGV